MSRQQKLFLLSAIVVIGSLLATSFFFGSYLFNQPIAKTVSVSELPVRKDNHRQGSGNAVTLLVFSDFQCPSCRSAASELTRITKDFDDQVTLVFKHFPLSQHGNAIDAAEAAEAAEAAGAQGHFWEMHDLLFKKQSAWESSSRPNDYFVDYARQLGLDIKQFRSDIKSKKFKGTIERDLADGKQLEVGFTPVIYINGNPLPGIPNYQNLKKAIEMELAQ